MFSLRAKLKDLKDHVPQGFKAVDGVRRLFPRGYAGSISMLNNYVFTYDSRGLDQGQMWMGADGAGRWFFAWWNNGAAGGGWGINERYQAGFVFRYSNDGFGHGCLDTRGPDLGATSCNSGTDAWIAQNWPQIFPANVACDLQDAAGFESLPDRSNIWTEAGFAASKFTALKGGNCQCAALFLTLFPFSDFYWGATAPQEALPIGTLAGSNPFTGGLFSSD